MTDIMKINVGPQHPSTHGVLRLVTELDGEKIISVSPEIGYLHRGLEKIAESKTYIQYLPLVDRIDYLGGFFTSYAFCSAVEHLANIEVPKRAEYIRTLCMELNRIASHLLWLGTYMLDLGASSPIFYTFRERDSILNLFEELTGQRMMYNYFTFGGVRFDVTNAWLDKVNDFMKILSKAISDYEKIISKNAIFLERTKNKGIITKPLCSKYAITGPNMRASGIKADFRKDMPYSVYDELDFVVSVNNLSDSYGRYLVRMQEMKTSMDIIKQCIMFLKQNTDGVNNKINLITLKIPDGEFTSYVESSRGLLCCYIQSDGSDKPYRVKWRTGSFYAVQVLPKLVIGQNFNDLIAIFGSLDVILPEVDR